MPAIRTALDGEHITDLKNSTVLAIGARRMGNNQIFFDCRRGIFLAARAKKLFNDCLLFLPCYLARSVASIKPEIFNFYSNQSAI